MHSQQFTSKAVLHFATFELNTIFYAFSHVIFNLHYTPHNNIQVIPNARL